MCAFRILSAIDLHVVKNIVLFYETCRSTIIHIVFKILLWRLKRVVFYLGQNKTAFFINGSVQFRPKSGLAPVVKLILIWIKLNLIFIDCVYIQYSVVIDLELVILTFVLRCKRYLVYFFLRSS